MLGLDDISFQFGRYGPVILLAIAIFFAAETLITMVLQTRRQKGQINQRLRARDAAGTGQEALLTLLRKRGLTGTGNYQLPFVAFNRLIMQSGLSIPIVRLLCIMAFGGVSMGLLGYTTLRDPLIALAIVALSGIAVPVLGLYMLRARRLKKFESQLPEAIDTMVRSMKAGHPLPVAISMVAKEMPDPIGTEFGLTADEMTYGLDLESAMGNLRTRAGQSDLAFFVVAISIQAKTGGNLAEILSNMSRMVRERSKMRRKIHALSAEGRFSAIALSVIPCAIYGIVSVSAPSYYQDVASDPMFMKSVYFGLAIWATGAYSLYRMVNFKT